MQEELTKKSAKLIDDYINGRIELRKDIIKRLKAELNICIQELEDLVWNMTCDPSQYPKLKKRLDDYYKLEKELNKVIKFYKELQFDKTRREFYKVGKEDGEEIQPMKMKLVKVTKKDSVKKTDTSTSYRKCDKWAQDLYNDSLHSIALPNYIIGNCKGMDLHEIEDVLESLEDAKTQFEKVLVNLNKAIKILEAEG